ncbi:MAG: prolipoprotein diacylglyceryl transferase [Terriglobia bacterium]
MHPFLINTGSFHIPTYGAMLALAFVSGIYIAIRLGRRVGVDSALILDFSSWVIVVAVLGAKVLMILTMWSYYRDHLGEIFSYATLKTAGVFYGGFLAALFFTIWFVWVRKISFWKFADVVAPSVALGTTVTRLGCFSAGCDYGKPTTVPWGVVFTNAFAHEVNGVPLGVRLHPAQLYESLTTLAIFGVLLWWFPRKKRDGDIFLGYLGLYAVGRFFLEFLRGDESRGFVFHHLLSTSQFIALIALAGLATVLLWRRLHPGEALTAVPEAINPPRAPQAGKAGLEDGFPPTRGGGDRKKRQRAKHQAYNAKLKAHGK